MYFSKVEPFQPFKLAKSTAQVQAYTVDCNEDDWVYDDDGGATCINEVGTYYVDSDGTVWFAQFDGLYGWYKDVDNNYDEFICEYTEGTEDDDGVECNMLYCEGGGYDDGAEVSWFSYTYYYFDGTTFSYRAITE
jgi:hypothetical protein